MPKKYTEEQKKERIAYLEEKINVSRKFLDWKEVKRLQNIKGFIKHKWGM